MNLFRSSLTRRSTFVLPALAGLTSLAPAVTAQEPGAFALSLLVEGLDRPVFMVDANDDSGRFSSWSSLGAFSSGATRPLRKHRGSI
ncbi:MAG: hypothetical protein R2839_05965 [Thermomicrobiales bacterium]